LWPLAARAQQDGRVRRIGVLTGLSEDDSAAQSLIAAFRQRLGALGWIEGRNISIEVRSAGADADRMRAYGIEFAHMVPDAVVVHGPKALMAVRQADDRIPLIFASMSDPVAAGIVASLARPGGNITGFTNYSGVPSPKLLQALKEVAPTVRRVAFLMTPDN